MAFVQKKQNILLFAVCAKEKKRNIVSAELALVI